MRAALYTSAHNSTRLTAGTAPMTFSNSTLSVLSIVSVVLSALAVLLVVGRSMRERRERVSSPLRADERLEVLVEAHGRGLARLEKAMRQLAT